jgi:cytochrome P450
VRRAQRFDLGASITLDQLERDPHPHLARLREHEPVSWLPALDGWLVTRYDLALEVMRDPAAFTVDDPRFSTARVIGPSMLSLDGAEHQRHRAPFVGPFRAREVHERFALAADEQAGLLVDALEPLGAGELRRSFAGPLAAAIVARSLGLTTEEVPTVLEWYDAIVAAVTEITAGRGDGGGGRRAFAELGARLRGVIAGADGMPQLAADAGESLLGAAAHGSELSNEQIVSNAAVLLFGGIETTEGMIANAIVHLLEDTARRDAVRWDAARLDGAIEESLRLEPAAAVIDRYATADVELARARIAKGDLVRVSIAGANRDPAIFRDPDRFEIGRASASASAGASASTGRRHLAFAQGPHVCVGVHLARLEARRGIAILLDRLPELSLDPNRPAVIRGLVFRKPPALHAVWEKPRTGRPDR